MKRILGIRSIHRYIRAVLYNWSLGWYGWKTRDTKSTRQHCGVWARLLSPHCRYYRQPAKRKPVHGRTENDAHSAAFCAEARRSSVRPRATEVKSGIKRPLEEISGPLFSDIFSLEEPFKQARLLGPGESYYNLHPLQALRGLARVKTERMAGR